MSIPDYQSLMKPILTVLADTDVLTSRALTERISVDLGLTDEERRETISSGMSLIANRVHWSVTYLAKAKAVDRPRRGHVQITQRGRDLLASGGEVRNSSLEQFSEFRTFRDKSRSKKILEPKTAESEDALEEQESPDDLIARAETDARSVLVAELLDKARSLDPAVFERLVIKVLTALGYGGSGLEPLHTGKSGDGGIDGIITEDKLGLDRIYLQAKCYREDHTVQASEVRNFLGALMGKGDRGVFLTTSTFTSGARSAVIGVPARVVLIDGGELVDLMIDHGVGVEPVRVATLHRINEDFFDAL